MKGKPSREDATRLIARSPQRGAVADLRTFAWEVLRRREDYQGSVAAIVAQGTVEMIEADPAPPQWGLCFRRRPRHPRAGSAVVLAARCGSDGNSRRDTSMPA